MGHRCKFLPSCAPFFFFQWEHATVMANPVMLYRAFLSELKKILKM